MLKFLILLFSIFSIVACATIQLGPSIGPLEEIILEGKGQEKILLIELQGVINNQKGLSVTGATTSLGMVEWVREVIDKAEKDRDIRALLIKINSPGGTVTASDIILHELLTYKKKQGIPIYIQVMDLAASGGYYIALAGDKIFAHPTSLIGSIGVIAFKVNLEGLMGKIGVTWEVVKSGDKKDFMSPFRPFSENEKELFQETINKFHYRFVSLIAKNRKELAIDDVKLVADGRIFDANNALNLKLIDNVAYLSETIDTIKKDTKNSELQVISYQREGDYKPNLYSFFSQPSGFDLSNLKTAIGNKILNPLFSYLWLP